MPIGCRDFNSGPRVPKPDIVLLRQISAVDCKIGPGRDTCVVRASDTADSVFRREHGVGTAARLHGRYLCLVHLAKSFALNHPASRLRSKRPIPMTA